MAPSPQYVLARKDARRIALAEAQAAEADRINEMLETSGLWTLEHRNGNHTVWRATHTPDLTICTSRCDEYVMTTNCHGIVTTRRPSINHEGE